MWGWVLGPLNTCKATVRVTSSGAQIVVVNFYIFYTFDTFLYFYTVLYMSSFCSSLCQDFVIVCYVCVLYPWRLILLSISFFLSSSLVLQVSQTHLVNKGEYSFFRESISTFQPIVLRQSYIIASCCSVTHSSITSQILTAVKSSLEQNQQQIIIKAVESAAFMLEDNLYSLLVLLPVLWFLSGCACSLINVQLVLYVCHFYCFCGCHSNVSH